MVGPVKKNNISFCLLFLFCLYCSNTVPKWVHHAIAPIVMALENYLPQPYAGEIRGMASHFEASPSDIILLNFAYEISAYV